ncbi:MAG: FtsX-like permease family protein [Thiovulaceae bacterium]|nr:FtsX-like permease family protein [Sulfurimonadaceae bacterium]MCW9025702.1 FtsX-like permease family protein [Sulfurimonadaceae bacterium]
MFYLAIKNILFYKGRSITTFILTYFSATLFIVYVAFMDGSHVSMLHNSLKVYTGSIQIYQKDYRDEGGYDYLIYDNQKIFDILNNTNGIKSYTSRIETFGIASSKTDSSAMMLTGVDFTRESGISELKNALVSGEYESSGNCLYMGSDLTKRLNVHVGDEISFVGNAIDYSFAADIFKVCGTFKTGMYEFDSSSAFLNREYFDSVFYSQNTSSYIVLNVNDLNENDKIAEAIKPKLDSQYRLYTWQELMSAMVEAMEVDSIFGYISMGLFFVVIFFVILIYGFINASSRIKEFGVLKSIGLSNSEVDKLLIYEMLILSLSAIFFATVSGGYLAYYYELNPIVIEGMSELYKDYGIISDSIPTRFSVFTITWNIGLILFLNLLSVIYPIYYIRRFNPIEAMRHV